MRRQSLPVKQILALLAAAPARIAETTGVLTEKQLHAAPDIGSGLPMKSWLICVRAPTIGGTAC